MSILEMALVFIIIPGVVLAIIAALTMRSAIPSTPRYVLGQQWTHPPLLWAAIDEPHRYSHDSSVSRVDSTGENLIGGSASGKW